jgi:hypothetical protein
MSCSGPIVYGPKSNIQGGSTYPEW